MYRMGTLSIVLVVLFSLAGQSIAGENSKTHQGATDQRGNEIVSMILTRPSKPLTPIPHPDNVTPITQCGQGQQQCRDGGSTWCCQSYEKCLYDTEECE